MRRLLLIGIASCLTACGGGSSDSGSAATPAPAPAPTPAPPPPSTSSLSDRIEITTPSAPVVGQSIGVVARLTSGSSIVTSQWRQTAGPSVALLSANSQVIGFDAPAAGDYSFTYQATDGTGASAEKTASFSVAAGDAMANVRLDHAVVEGGKVSLRVDSPTPDAISSVNWQQLSGPTPAASSVETQGNFLFFDAPTVPNDQLIRYRATITMSDGQQFSDESSVLVKNNTINSQGFFPSALGRNVSAEMHPYNADSPYADALSACVYNNQIDASCSFSQLPLIGQENQAPSVEDIMDRVLVSHQWMGDRFREYLQESPVASDMITLLRATTAVVISYEVRPSFYWSATGAIYLDADNFWVTPQERDTLNDVPDFRSSFGQELQFIMPWRYVRNNRSYLNARSYPRAERLSRSQADVQADITWLMYHELAHANDFFPFTSWANLSGSDSPLSYSRNNPAVSDTFEVQFPLGSSQMRSLAQVSFAGAQSTALQQSYQGADIQGFFEPDDASFFYSYFTEKEDFASLFERFMMAHRLGVYADVAVIEVNNNPNFNVFWGQRGRINDPKLQARTAFVVPRLFPEIDVNAAQQALESPIMLTPGVSWFDNMITPTNARGIERPQELLLHSLHIGRPGLPQQ